MLPSGENAIPPSSAGLFDRFSFPAPSEPIIQISSGYSGMPKAIRPPSGDQLKSSISGSSGVMLIPPDPSAFTRQISPVYSSTGPHRQPMVFPSGDQAGSTSSKSSVWVICFTLDPSAYMMYSS